MKKIYQSPEVEVMNFAAVEKLAVIEFGNEEIGLGVGGASTGDIEL